jgi:hypothetical protein
MMQVFSKIIGAIKQFWCIYLSFIQFYKNYLNFWLHLCKFYTKIRKKIAFLVNFISILTQKQQIKQHFGLR